MKKSKFESKLLILDNYINGLKDELKVKVLRQINIIDNYILTVTGHPNVLIFFKKLEADLYRYLAKHKVG
jgi:hypothetical protein